MLLETRDISCMFGGFFAVVDVNLQVEDRAIHCLIGPNGAGKSTLFKLITGTYRATGGQIIFRGSDVTRLPSFARIQRGMSIKMQTPSVFNGLSVRQNLHVALQRHLGSPALQREQDRIMSILDLGKHAQQAAGELSHGQRQWLEIGMALAANPTLLLLDEPTAGLSVEETLRTGELVRRFRDDGITILVVEHDMSFVRQIATHVTVLHLGRTFAEGTVDEIMTDPRVGEIYLGTPHAESA